MSGQTIIEWVSSIWVNFLAPLGDWLWLAIVPFGVFIWQLVKRLGKKYAKDFEEAAGSLLEDLGRKTFQLLCTFGFEKKYRQHLINTFRTYEIQGLKTRGPFTLDLESVFVPLRVSTESPQNASSDLLRIREASTNQSIWEFLTAVVIESAYRRIAVIAAPGSGKTTLLRHLTLIHAQGRQGRYHRNARNWLPILLYLRDIRSAIEADPDLDLAELIAGQKTIQELRPDTGWFKRVMQKGRCLVLLDGLDEVAEPGQRQIVGRWSDRQMLAYPNACFVLTSRPFGYGNCQVRCRIY